MEGLPISTSLHNLPAQLIPIVGREKEIDDLVGLLKHPEIGLITLHGFGGIGKTRLAVETGRAALEFFPAGVWFVALAPLSSPEHIISATAAAIRFSFQSHDDQQGQLIHFLRDKKLLLIFDNLEHLLPAGASYLEALLQNATETRILVTSRQPINAPWEWVYQLHGLDYGADPSLPDREVPAAAQLFLQHLSRAGAPEAENDRVCAIRICEMVKGLPLALLLAASWGRALGCDEIFHEIQHGLGILNAWQTTFPEKHSSMQAVFDYSWRLLTEEEQAALRKLAVFPGGFDRNAATEVAGANLPVIAALVDKCLLERTSDNRYQIHELLRQYLQEQLAEAGEERSVRGQHLDFYVRVTKQAEFELVGEELDRWIKWFTVEIDNIRAAFEWSLENREPTSLKKGLSLLLQLARLWQLHNYLKEGSSLANRLLAALPVESNRRLHAEGLNFASELSFRLRDYPKARKLTREVLRLGLEINDSHLVGDAYYWQAFDAFMQNDLGTSHSLVQQALDNYQKIDVPLKISRVLNLFGNIEFYLGNFVTAYQYHSEALDIARTWRDEISMSVILQSLAALASVEPSIGLARSRRWIEEGLKYARKVNDITLVQTFLMYLAEDLRQEGQYDEAAKVYEETVQTINETVPQEEYIIIWLNLGFAYLRLGKHDRSRQIFLDNLVAIQESNRSVYHELPHCLLGLAGVAVADGKFQLASKILGALEAHKPAITFWPTDRSEYERIYAALKAQLIEKQFNQLIKEGQMLTLSDAAHLIQSQEWKEKAPTNERLNQLTKRELEILRLVAQGLTDVQIAQRLVLSPRTVNAHLTSIYRKLDVKSRAAATRFSVEHRLP